MKDPVQRQPATGAHKINDDLPHIGEKKIGVFIEHEDVYKIQLPDASGFESIEGRGVSAEVGGARTVSYTHLDVYKRQEKGRSYCEESVYACFSDKGSNNFTDL